MKIIKLTAASLGILLAIICASCVFREDPPVVTLPPVARVEDMRQLTDHDYTKLSITATDELGRSIRVSDTAKEDKQRMTGIFYFAWLGHHNFHENKIYDITKLLENDREGLFTIDKFYADSPSDKFHFWGEPLYGYYNSEDPWVITRHIEMLTMASIDYIVFDVTNSFTYDAAVETLLDKLLYFQEQGFNVPKIAFYTNSHSASTLSYLYNRHYRAGTQNAEKYSSLWLRLEEKPVIIGVSGDLSPSQLQTYTAFFDLRESQWPDDSTQYDNGFPWMSWDMEQAVQGGTISVSLAQHPGYRMSEGARSNRGRGFSFEQARNISSKFRYGLNAEGQWATVFAKEDQVDNVFITGFNEWVAIKLDDGNDVFFVDTFNEEYSRDIEPMRGGYGDAFYLQMIDYIKKFKYEEAVRYIVPKTTVDITDSSLQAFEGASKYLDFKGDTLNRSFPGFNQSLYYTDSSGRNDIVSVRVLSDNQNFYFCVETEDDITEYPAGTENWMNILIRNQGGDNTFGGYNYLINRSPNNGVTTVEKSTGGYNWINTGSAQINVFGNIMLLSVPRAALGMGGDDFAIEFKVSDNVTAYKDISDYYVTGDSAPIGRLSYAYGY